MQENDEVTPIYSLVESEKLKHIKIIVQHPRMNFERQYPEESPLIGAIRKGNPKIVEILLKSGADPEETDGTSTAEPLDACLLYTSPSPRDQRGSRMPSSA